MALSDPLDDAVNRLNRNMAITQTALTLTPPAALFILNVEALKSAVDELAVLLELAPPGRVISASSQVIGPATAELLAKAIEAGSITPDTVPDSWKD